MLYEIASSLLIWLFLFLNYIGYIVINFENKKTEFKIEYHFIKNVKILLLFNSYYCGQAAWDFAAKYFCIVLLFTPMRMEKKSGQTRINPLELVGTWYA